MNDLRKKFEKFMDVKEILIRFGITLALLWLYIALVVIASVAFGGIWAWLVGVSIPISAFVGIIWWDVEKRL